VCSRFRCLEAEFFESDSGNCRFNGSGDLGGFDFGNFAASVDRIHGRVWGGSGVGQYATDDGCPSSDGTKYEVT